MKNLKKKALMAGSLVAAAAIAVGGTLAYANLSYDDEGALNTLTVGEAVDIAINEYQRNEEGTALEAFEQGKELLPIVGSAQAANTDANGNPTTDENDNMDKWGMPEAENYGDKIVTVKNTGDTAAFIRVFVAMPTELIDFAKDGSADTSDDALHWNWGNRVDIKGGYSKEDYALANWGWAYNIDDEFTAVIDEQEYIVSTFYLKKELAIGDESTAVMTGVYLDSKVDYDDGVWTMGDYVIDYDLSNGVNVPIYAEAVAAEGLTWETAFDKDVKEVFKNWADTVTGSVVAAPESGAVRPAGYAPATEGEVINSLVVVDESAADTNLRALYKNGLTGDVTVKNSYLDGTYAMNLTVAASTTDADLTVSGTVLKGWVSYSGFASASFTNCSFDENTNLETYKVIRPYDTTVFTNCDFAEGYEFWLDKLDGATITLDNCTIGGVAITDASQLNIVYGTADSVVIK